MSVAPIVSQSPDEKDIIEISTIKLNLNGLVVELRVEQARELWKKLDEVFGPKPATWIYTDYAWTHPKPIWISEPTWTGDPLPRPFEVTCNAYTGNTLELR